MGRAGIIRLVADPYPPYQYLEGNDIKGVDHDLIMTCLRSLGYEVSVNLLPWEECLASVERGDAHGIFQITKTPERERKYIFPREPLRVAKTVLVVRPGGESTPQQSLNKVGVVSGYSYGQLFKNFPFIKVPVDSQEELFFHLLKGEFDFAAIDLGVARYLARKHGLNKLETVQGLEVDRELFVAFHKEMDPNFVEAFSSRLHALKEEGVFAKIAAHYGL